MSLPRAVAEAERLADEAHAKAYTAPPAQSTEQTPAAQPSATPAPEPPKPPAAKAPDTEQTWEARYKALAGKYNAEVPRLTAANGDLTEKLAKATSTLDDVTARLTKLEKEKSAAPLVKPDEVEAFGEPLIDVMRRVSREEIGKMAPEVTVDDIKSVRADVDEIRVTHARTAQGTFLERLTDLVSDWREINVDPAFVAWLAEIDPLFGEERQVGLALAQRNNDAPRAARFFETFKAMSSTRAAAAPPDPMAGLVTPDSRTPPTPPRGKHVFTRREIAEFYANWRAGRIKDEDAVAMEAEINAALAERRVR